MNIENMTLEELAAVQEKHRQQMATNRDRVAERKARTHRLIVIGSALAKLMPQLNEIDEDEIEASVAEAVGDKADH